MSSPLPGLVAKTFEGFLKHSTSVLQLSPLKSEDLRHGTWWLTMSKVSAGPSGPGLLRE